jgi:putative transposase
MFGINLSKKGLPIHNREIIGSAVGEKKDARLVEKALLSVPYSLKDINIFHSDRGNEYDNKLIDNVLKAFEIERSLSNKGNPYDNAVSEAVNKIMKTEFIYQNKFKTLEELQLELAEYIYWYNNLRIHGSLGYLTPVEYRELGTLKLAG